MNYLMYGVCTMVQLKKDEKIMAVVIGAIIIVDVLALLFKISLINDLLPLIAVTVAWYTLYLSRRPKETKFKFIEARITNRDEPIFQVKVFVQNIGEGIALLRWESIYIDLDGKRYDMYSPIEWEWQTQPNTQTFKGFSFNIPVHIGLSGGYFVAKGAYSTHEEKMIEKTWKIALSGDVEPMDLSGKMPSFSKRSKRKRVETKKKDS